MDGSLGLLFVDLDSPVGWRSKSLCTLPLLMFLLALSCFFYQIIDRGSIGNYVFIYLFVYFPGLWGVEGILHLRFLVKACDTRLALGALN